MLLIKKIIKTTVDTLIITLLIGGGIYNILNGNVTTGLITTLIGTGLVFTSKWDRNVLSDKMEV